MPRTLISETPKLIGQMVMLAGWAHIRRDHGKLIFIDLRDRSGIIQLVIIPDKEEAYKAAKDVRSEFVLKVEGLVKARPGGAANEKIATGGVELEVERLTILNQAKALPFEVSKDTKDINEELRLKYRYLDLRTERMKNNTIMRHKIVKFMRDYCDTQGFIEVETPALTKGTPEGSREFIVPSRLHKGKFYVLPQSPQQFKQLLMVAGLEKYFQIARCFRDEDQRGDRQPEFMQLDMEMSFIEQEDIIRIIEGLMIELIKNIYPEKKIAQIPFPRLTWDEAMKKYNSDKPDLRKNKEDPNELALEWVVDFPMFSRDKEGNLGAEHHPFTSPKAEDMPTLESNPEKVRANAYDIILNGNEIGGGSIRIHDRTIQHRVFQVLGIKEEDIQKRFGHMLDAFTYGAPPHGGIALGIDRIVAILQGEINIREVIVFPKTGEAEDLLMGAPSEIEESQLQELGIKKAPSKALKVKIQTKK